MIVVLGFELLDLCFVDWFFDLFKNLVVVDVVVGGLVVYGIEWEIVELFVLVDVVVMLKCMLVYDGGMVKIG